MLIPKNLSPDDCVYVNATYVLQSLFRNRVQSLADLFCDVRAHRAMSFSLFVLCLDWLYLCDCIKFENEKIALCS